MGEGQPEQDFFSDNNVIQKKEKKKTKCLSTKYFL